MHSISQLQFPPLKKLEILAKNKKCTHELEIFEFLQQLSVSWDQLWQMSQKWSDLPRQKAVRGINKSLQGDISGYTESIAVDMPTVEEQNQKRFFELACEWIHQHKPQYFEKMLTIAQAISRFEVPEPESSVLTMTLPAEEWSEHAGKLIKHDILLRSWHKSKIFIVQQNGCVEDKSNLEFFGFEEGDELLVDLEEVRRFLLKSRIELRGYTGHWRAPHAGAYGRFKEIWTVLGNPKEEDPSDRHTGTEVLDLFFRTASDAKAKKPLLPINKFLSESPEEEEMADLFDWACEEDGRIII